MLLKKLVKPASRKKYPVSFMPHLRTMNEVSKDACLELGWGYISPKRSVEEVIQMIAESEILIAEAMHGAIVADTLRVPWIPVVTHPSIYKFKWLDWCSSMQLEYEPVYLSVKQYRQHLGNDLLTPARQLRNKVGNWLYLKEMMASLKKVISSERVFLSKENHQDVTIDRLQGKLEEFKEDFAPQRI
jgi:succinoglycan biosynthesis protein ExoV